MNLIQRLKNKIIFEKRKFLSRKDQIKKTQYGFKIILDLKKDVDLYFYEDNFEKDTLSFFASILKPGNVVLDIGANIGIYTLLASIKVGSTGKVYAFEPAKWANYRLRKNIELNYRTNIEVINKAVSDHSGYCDFHICEDDAYNSLGNNPMRVVKDIKTIEVISIDEFVSQKGLSHVEIVKIDTEGADYLVLKGAKKLLSSPNPPVVFCEYNRDIKNGFNHNLNEFEEYIKSFNYQLYEIKENQLVVFNSAISSSSEIICIKNA